MSLRNGRLLVALLTTALLSVTSFAMDTNQMDHDYMRITQLRESKDIVGLENVIRNNSGKWSQMDREAYGRLMAHALKSLDSICNETGEIDSMNRMRKYAEHVLSAYNTNQTDNISTETEFALVSILHEKYTYSKGRHTDHEWSNARRKGAKAFLHAWQRLENALAEDGNSIDLPEENVDIPEGVAGFPGMSPERIDDPIRRAEYERAIRANKKKIDIYNSRIRLQNNRKRYFRLVRKYLVSTYSIAPYDSSELRALLETYVKDPDTRDQFVEGIDMDQP